MTPDLSYYWEAREKCQDNKWDEEKIFMYEYTKCMCMSHVFLRFRGVNLPWIVFDSRVTGACPVTTALIERATSAVLLSV